MFLICSSALLQIVKSGLQFIEENSVLLGIVTSIIVSSLWFMKFIKQKRAEAFFGFYSKLSLCIKSLQTLLEEKGQLNILDAESGNIYTLIYTDDYIKEICPKYKMPEKEERKLYKSKVHELKEILFDTETNVYPQGSNRREWYTSQQTLFLFCEFIENDAYQHVTNENYAEGENEQKHIVKCKLLIEAFDYILNSINRAKY